MYIHSTKGQTNIDQVDLRTNTGLDKIFIRLKPRWISQLAAGRHRCGVRQLLSGSTQMIMPMGIRDTGKSGTELNFVVL